MEKFVTIEMKTPGFTGWKTVKGMKMYFEYGYLRSALNAKRECVHAYIPSKFGGLDLTTSLTESAVRARLRRGTIWFR